tara:strand:+ start:1017 stop:1850 length:834 start_codon:yes stop_codon:yes gene_type:complete
MKLLFENWKKYIKENVEYFGADFVDYKNRTATGEHPVTTAKELFGSPIGKGSTRIVFAVGTEFVLKVINIPEQYSDEAELEKPDLTGFTKSHKLKANEYESDLKMQMQYSEIFPRTFETAEDSSWILAERVQPIKYAELFDRLGITELVKSKERYKLAIEVAYQFMKDRNLHGKSDTYISQMLKEVDSYMADTYKNATQTMTLAPHKTLSDTIKEPQNQTEKFNFFEIPKRMLQNTEFSKILSTAAFLEIPARELKAGNLGISTLSGKLVILDTSLW